MAHGANWRLKMASKVITVDLNSVGKWVDNAGDMVLTPHAEDALSQLLSLQELIDNAVKTAKENIEKEALAYNENFSGLKTSKFKISYRAYGGRYKLDPQYITDLPKELYKKIVKYNPDTKAIDAYVDTNDGLIPEGILEVERTKQISIKELNAKV